MKKQDFLEYAELYGNQAGADLMLLAGPDGYEGSYAEFCELYEKLSGGERWLEWEKN